MSPQTFLDTLAMTSVNGNFKATDALSFQTNFYYRGASRKSFAGNITEVQPCDASIPNTLCFGNSATVLVDTSGNPVMNILNGLPPGQDDNATVTSVGLGGSAQATYTAPLFGHDNHLVVGASLDHGNVDYTSVNIVSVIDPVSLVATPLGPIISQPDGALVPIRLETTNSYYGVYFSDTFNITPELAVTAGGRYNLAMIRLIDKLGSALNGNNRFARFNPAFGATYKFGPGLTGYFGYAEANRAPTAGEIGCSDPTRPCSLDLFVSADPPGLRQVVARTYETGLRGRLTLGANDERGADRLEPRPVPHRSAGRHHRRAERDHQHRVFQEHPGHAAPGHRGRHRLPRPQMAARRELQPDRRDIREQGGAGRSDQSKSRRRRRRSMSCRGTGYPASRATG